MLHRKFKKAIGKSPSDYITEIRLNHARVLLENDVATVSEIAYRVGFSDPSYFNKVFKKHFSLSPGKIRVNKLSETLKSKIYRTFISTVKGVLFKAVVIFILIIIVGGGTYYIFLDDRSLDRSVAVLPLHNLTGDPEKTYLVDGLHDALIGELGGIKSLRVISRTSTLRYRNSDMLLQAIAEELGVNTIVEGSVIAAGDSLSLLIQLIDVFPEENHLLAREYNDAMHNVLNVQSAVVKDIVQKTSIELSVDEEDLLKKSRMVDPETYKDYLRGMFYLNQGTDESFETGMQFMIKAIKRDPGDPFAYAALSLAYAIKGHSMVTPVESFRSAEAAAERALRIDPTIDEAHTALALIYLYKYWDWTRARDAFENAIFHNPNNAVAHAHYAWYYFLYGEKQKSIYHLKTAVTLEPLSASYISWLALIYYSFGEFDKAERSAKKALELKENMPYGNLAMGWIYLRNKQYEKAIELHSKLPLYGDYYKMFIGYTYVISGERDKALAIWNEWEEYSKKNWVNPFHRGILASILGFHDEAFKCLNEAIDNKYYPSNFIVLFPGVEFIRDDPRYKMLFRKMNLPYRSMLASESTSQ